MKDQYGDSVPDDLVILSVDFSCSELELQAIDKLRWYEPCRDQHPILALNHIILVSYDELIKILDDYVEEELGVKLRKVDYIASVLHRWELDDSGIPTFYHA